MKHLAILFLIFISFSAVSQETGKETTLYALKDVDVKPDFEGGLVKFYEYVNANYKSPEVADLRGKVFVTFIIETDGSLSDIKVIRDIGYGTGEEAIRVMKESLKWIPAQKGGVAVRTLYSLPITVGQKFSR
jgi:protein TonB